MCALHTVTVAFLCRVQIFLLSYFAPSVLFGQIQPLFLCVLVHNLKLVAIISQNVTLLNNTLQATLQSITCIHGLYTKIWWHKICTNERQF